MDEAFAIDGDADVQFLVCEVHEDEITRLQFAASHRYSGSQLLLSGAGHGNAGAACRIHD